MNFGVFSLTITWIDYIAFDLLLPSGNSAINFHISSLTQDLNELYVCVCLCMFVSLHFQVERLKRSYY